MQRILIGVILCAWAATGNAAIYRSVDPDGTVVYSDTPRPGAETMTLPPPSTVPAPPPRRATSTRRAPPDAAPPPLSIDLLQPENNANFFNSPVIISVRITPKLPAGAKLTALVDGNKAGELSGNGLTLDALDRGSHQVQVVASDAQGNTLASSNSVTVHMHLMTVTPR